MGVDPEEFNNHADKLEDSFSDEISIRCQISRRYYAAFHIVREQGESYEEANFSYEGGDHKQATEFLEDIDHKNLADDLETLRYERNKADYDINDIIGKGDAAYANAITTALIPKLKKKL